jgi:hypothetical protein
MRLAPGCAPSLLIGALAVRRGVFSIKSMKCRLGSTLAPVRPGLAYIPLATNQRLGGKCGQQFGDNCGRLPRTARSECSAELPPAADALGINPSFSWPPSQARSVGGSLLHGTGRDWRTGNHLSQLLATAAWV